MSASIFFNNDAAVTVVTSTTVSLKLPSLTAYGTGPQSGFQWDVQFFSSITNAQVAETTGTGYPSATYVFAGLPPNTPIFTVISVTDPSSGAHNTSASAGIEPTFTTATVVTLGSLTVLSTGVTTVSVSHPAAQNGTPGFTFQWYRNAGSSTFVPGSGNILTGQTGTTLNDSGLTAATVYSYICIVTDSASYTASSSQLTLTTNANLAIATPTVGIVGSTIVNLSITQATGGNPSYAYQWYRSTTSGFTPGPSSILNGQTSLTLADSGLTANTTYFYKVVVTDSAANTVNSNQATLTTVSPLTVVTPTLSSKTATSVVVISTGAGGGLAPYAYQWFRSTTSGFAPSNASILVGQTSLTLNDSGLTASTTYYYVIQVTDAALDVTNSIQLSVVTNSAPLALGSIVINSVGQTAVTLSVPNATGGAPAYSYGWYRSSVSGSIGTSLSHTTQTITDTGLTPDTQYYYTAVVMDSASPTPATVDSPQAGVITTAVSTLGEYYANLLILEYIGQPNASAMISAIANMVTMPATSTQTADDILPLVVQNAYNLTTASGVQLNIIGAYLGVTRYSTDFNGNSIVLSDADFQTLIKLAAASRISGNSLADIDNFLYTNFPGEVFITDNLNMSISYLINSSVGSQNLIDAFINEELLPKPMAVAIGAVIVNPSLNFFGFSSYGPNGTWIPAAPLVQGFNTYSSYNTNSPWLTYQMAIKSGI
jgi:hypothetical protein